METIHTHANGNARARMHAATDIATTHGYMIKVPLYYRIDNQVGSDQVTTVTICHYRARVVQPMEIRKNSGFILTSIGVKYNEPFGLGRFATDHSLTKAASRPLFARIRRYAPQGDHQKYHI